jgi:excisionase family DNA binding protein
MVRGRGLKGKEEMEKAHLDREGYSIPEAAVVASIGRTKIYEAIGDGSLIARKHGRRTIILRDDLHAFLTALPAVK